MQIAALRNLKLNISRAKLRQKAGKQRNRFYITDKRTSDKVVKSARLEEIRLTILQNLLKYHPESVDELAWGGKISKPETRNNLEPLGPAHRFCSHTPSFLIVSIVKSGIDTTSKTQANALAIALAIALVLLVLEKIFWDHARSLLTISHSLPLGKLFKAGHHTSASVSTWPAKRVCKREALSHHDPQATERAWKLERRMLRMRYGKEIGTLPRASCPVAWCECYCLGCTAVGQVGVPAATCMFQHLGGSLS